MSIKDPIASSMANLITQINTISTSISDVLNTIDASESKPEVKLKNIEAVKARVNTLEGFITKLDLLNTTIDIASKALLAQELVITSNPISAAAYEVAKKAFTIMSYKTTLESLAEVVKSSVESSRGSLKDISSKIEQKESEMKANLNQ